MDLNDPSWRDSQIDTVEQVLILLPVPDLCRYRTVCKQWNELICSRHFAALHSPNRANPQDATFIVLRYVKRRIPREQNQNRIFECGWCILDLNAKRWYTIRDTNPHRFLQDRPDIVAMDGGLVVQLSGTRRSENSLIVYNPIENKAKFLPAAPDFETCDGYPELSFMVDPISQSFKAFLINHDHKKTARLNAPSTSEQERAWIRNDPLVRVYDSVSHEWESLVNPDWDTSVIRPLRSSVMLQSRLFLLFGTHRYAFQDYALWVYNLVEEDWLNLATVDIPDYFYNPKLVMTADRLFLAAWSLDPPLFFDLLERSTFEVQEIDMVQMVRKPPVLKLSKGDLESRFGMQSAWEKYPEMVVIGMRNARLMVMATSSGKCGVFDVVRGCWEEEKVPENPLGQMPEKEERVWTGKNMKLLLPSALLYMLL